MTTKPIGRTTRLSLYSPGNEHPTVLHGTWLEAESFAYPKGGRENELDGQALPEPDDPLDLYPSEDRSKL